MRRAASEGAQPSQRLQTVTAGGSLPSLQQVLSSRYGQRGVPKAAASEAGPSGTTSMSRTASAASPPVFHERVAAMRVHSAQEVRGAGFQPMGSGFYRCAHAIWELRGDGDELALVRKQEERLPDFR